MVRRDKRVVRAETMMEELLACRRAIQSDQGGRNEYELAHALETVLRWIETPAYSERVAWCDEKYSNFPK